MLCNNCGRRQPTDEFPQGRACCRGCKQARDRVREAARRGSPVAVDREDVAKLPIGPFREWLVQETTKLEFSHQEKAARAVLADRLGVSTRRLYDWLFINQTVSLDGADRAFCQAGMPWLLAQMWPELYDFDGRVAA